MEHTLVGRTEVEGVLCDCAMTLDGAIVELPRAAGHEPPYSFEPGTPVVVSKGRVQQLGAAGEQRNRLIRAAKPWRFEQGTMEQRCVINGVAARCACRFWWSPGIFGDKLRWYPKQEFGGPRMVDGQRFPRSPCIPDTTVQKEVVVTQFPLFRIDGQDGEIRYEWRGPSEGVGSVGFGGGTSVKFNETLLRYPLGGPPKCLPAGTVLGLLTSPHKFGTFRDPATDTMVRFGFLKIGSIIHLAGEDLALNERPDLEKQSILAELIFRKMVDKRPVGGALWLHISELSPFLINSLKKVGWAYSYKQRLPYCKELGFTEPAMDVAKRLALDVVAGETQFYTELLAKL
jgi:hypothetical protein